jgi:hypothetical protein
MPITRLEFAGTSVVPMVKSKLATSLPPSVTRQVTFGPTVTR